MLVELSIRNFAIIKSLTVPFRRGLHAMTGETGAGKSIILDAVSLLIGGRASVDFVRHGANKAEIEGLFELDEDHPVFALLVELGIETEDQVIILRRDVSTLGKSVCRVNGKLVTLAILREIGQALVDIHGQYEHQSLLHEEKHLALLDEYGKDKINSQKQEYRKLYDQYKKITAQIKQLTEGEQQLAQRLDLLKFQFDEIAAAQLDPEEYEQLHKERKKQAYSQKIYKGISESYQALQSEGGALDTIGLAMSYLQDIANYDEELKQQAEQVESIYYQLEDIVHQLSRRHDQVEMDPERINYIEARLQLIDQLKRKYGSDIHEILVYASKIEDELDSIEYKEERIEELIHKQQNILADLVIEAQNLTKIRTNIAKELIQKITTELTGLHMDKTVIDIQIKSAESGDEVEYGGHDYRLRSDGCDDVAIYISPNPGEPLKPLSKIASGGELSRLMLALKTVFSKLEPVATLIFDEVDTGVSGRVAQAMGDKLYQISKDQQVLCITHHPQVAAMADEHYRIVKEIVGEETKTSIVPLQKEERIEELARMMSGMEVTSVTLQHAEELILSAEKIKEGVSSALNRI